MVGDFPIYNNPDITINEEITLEDIPLYDWKRYSPKKYEDMKEQVFNKPKYRVDNNYICAHCGKKSPHRGLFQIDHITPMSKGGKTVSDNLQLLCRTCNMKKGNKI